MFLASPGLHRHSNAPVKRKPGLGPTRPNSMQVTEPPCARNEWTHDGDLSELNTSHTCRHRPVKPPTLNS